MQKEDNSKHFYSNVLDFSTTTEGTNNLYLNSSIRQATKIVPNEESKYLRLIAGGLSAFVATAVTCPLDVIKTRQQSSLEYSISRDSMTSSNLKLNQMRVNSIANFSSHAGAQLTMFQHLLHMWKYEGAGSFFKGLAPSLIGAVSSRAIFFCTYEYLKEILQNKSSSTNRKSSTNHVLAAVGGGVTCTTLTCPLWVIKIRQQLHKRQNGRALSMLECCQKTWKLEGIPGFFRGLVVSYSGVAELVVYFTLYEKLRDFYLSCRHSNFTSSESMRDVWDLPGLMILSGFSRCVSCVSCYPAGT